jgi:glucosamine-6-phosphate deaminase
MGIGENGHIAFNDPHVAFFNDEKVIKEVELDFKCRNQQVNDGCFTSIDKVPTHALTLTIPTLTACDYIFCIVPAITKADAVYNTVKGEVTESCPASILQKHKNAVLYTDKDSASKIL